MSEQHSADTDAPLTMTPEQWLGALADAFDAGVSADPYRLRAPDSRHP